MSKMGKVTENQFTLTRLKRKSDGIIHIEYDLELPDGSETYIERMIQDSTKIPHPDLMIPLKEMGKCLADCWGVAKSEDIEVTGVSIHKANTDNRNAIITGTKKIIKNNSKVPMNSARITLSANTFGFEQELEKCVDQLSAEVYKFVFENKKAQLDLDMPDAEGKQNELPLKTKKTKKAKEEDDAAAEE